jgi:hypothetical protein
MSPRETLVAETREWLERARADLDACDALIAVGLPPEALFHAQQCAEKAIKAVLTWHQVSFKKTHDLDELKQMCLPLAEDATAHLALRILPNGQRRKRPGTQPGGFWTRWPLGSNRSSVIDSGQASSDRNSGRRSEPRLRGGRSKPGVLLHARRVPIFVESPQRSTDPGRLFTGPA